MRRVFVLIVFVVSQLFADACKISFQVTSPIGERLSGFEVRLASLKTLKEFRFSSGPALIACGWYHVNISSPGFASVSKVLDLDSSGIVATPLQVGSVGAPHIDARMILISMAGAAAQRVDRLILLSANNAAVSSFYVEGQKQVRVKPTEPGEGIIDLN